MAPKIIDLDRDRDHTVAFDARQAEEQEGGQEKKGRGIRRERCGFFSLENSGWVLVLYNFFLALPTAYALAWANKAVLSWVGYEEIMRCPSGVLLSRALFVGVNMWLVVGWGVQLEQKAMERKRERVERIREEVEWWDGEVEMLESVLGGVKEISAQVLGEGPEARGFVKADSVSIADFADDEADEGDEVRISISLRREVFTGKGAVST